MRWSEQATGGVPVIDSMASGQLHGQPHHAIVGVQHPPPRGSNLIPPGPPPGIIPGMEYVQQPVTRAQQDDQQDPYFCQRTQEADYNAQREKSGRWTIVDDTLVEVSEAHNLNASLPLGSTIAPTAAKKLWGVEDASKENKGLFNIGEQTWRDAAWSTGHPTEPGVAQSLGMGVGQRGPRGQFPGESVLSPRGAETGGVGVKMVEYLLASSPTTKDIDTRMAQMTLRNGGVVDPNKDKKDKSQSPFDNTKKDVENGNIVVPQANGTVVQNGLDDDKTFNGQLMSSGASMHQHLSTRTPGSRQGSPSEEDHAKNGLMGVVKEEMVGGGVVMGPNGQVMGLEHSFDGVNVSAGAMNNINATMANISNMSAAAVGMGNMTNLANMGNMAAGMGMGNMNNMANTMANSMNNAMGNAMGNMGNINTINTINTAGMGNHAGLLDPNAMNSGPFSTAGGQEYNTMATSMPMDSPSILNGQQQNFQENQLFRNGGQQQGTPQQLQLLAAQQQYLAAQQQGLQVPQTFNTPYVINAQEPYVGPLIAGPTAVIPQYYGVHWGVYPANIIQQQGGPNQQRRPPSPPAQNEGVVSTQNNQQGNLAAAAAAAAAGNIQQGQLGQYQVIPTYYDQNGQMIMGNLRGVGNGGPVRLVSPAPIIINSANGAAQANNMRLINNQAPQIATPPASLYNTSQAQNLTNSFSASTLTDSLSSGLQQNSSNALTGNNYSLSLQNNSLGFGNGALGTIGSPSIGNLAAGLGNSMGRRDSLDRTSSVLSPLSQDFRTKNWATNYGALGTVTASPGPIGLPSGSLTPPSLSSSSSALPFGALMSGNRVISAAPGAEAKFRTGTNGIFNTGGPSSSLFPPLKRNLSLDKCTGRSRLLEDFRNNRFPNLQLRDLANHIVEFSQDQHGSRFIQQKLERATPSDKQMVFNEILNAAYSLMTDVFGNYVIQKFFEFGSPEQKGVLANKIRGHVLPLALQMYGCRVIQKALECITQEQQKDIVRELDGHVLKCVKDQNGNHVVQKCIECVDPGALQFIINAFQGQVFSLSTHPYGCRVIQRILEHCTIEQTQPILDELHSHTEQLLQDQYGNYVIQHVLEHGKPEDKSKIVAVVRGAVMKLSQHKFASNVVEKCVTHATRSERTALIDEVAQAITPPSVCGGYGTDQSHSNLLILMKDQYANYVVQKMIDVAEQSQRKMLMHRIRPHISTLKKYTYGEYGKHIIAKLEKYFMKNPSENLPGNMQPL